MESANDASAESPVSSSSLPRRIASVVVLIPVVLGAAYWGIWPSTLLVVFAVLVGLHELYNLLRYGGYQPRRAIGLSGGLLLCAAALFQGTVPFDLAGATISLLLLASLINELHPRNRSASLANWALTFAGTYYIGGLLSYYILLRRLDTPLVGGWLAALNIPSGAAWVFLVLGITWLQDTAAFFVGRAYGRHKLAPYISPNKSWEGIAGGFVASILAALLLVELLGLPLGLPMAIVIGAACGVAGPLGDLVESLVKRQLGLKDSGQLIPGHGGLLDRLDSLLFNAPVVYYLILLTVLL